MILLKIALIMLLIDIVNVVIMKAYGRSLNLADKWRFMAKNYTTFEKWYLGISGYFRLATFIMCGVAIVQLIFIFL